MATSENKPVGLDKIASQFDIRAGIADISTLGGGFINSTYLVRTEGENPDYVLQRKNGEIFLDVPGMMDNILKVTRHIRANVEKNGGDVSREVMNVVTTPDGKPYVVDNNGEYWTMSLFIPRTVTHEYADTPELAYKGGEGIGRFHMQLADFNQPLNETIKGFHNLDYRFRQWEKAVNDDKAGRVKDLSAEIQWIDGRKERMMDFWKLVENGTLPRRVTHNDTKLGNILFDKDDNVLCVIDLDTVMSNTLLTDYGDAIRSFANTAAEDEPDTDKIRLNLDVFEQYTKGYLSQTKKFLNDAEKEWLAFGPLFLTFEQTLRFLMDYIDGDTYYRIAYPTHNLVRATAQNKLLESMEQNYSRMREIVSNVLIGNNL